MTAPGERVLNTEHEPDDAPLNAPVVISTVSTPTTM